MKDRLQKRLESHHRSPTEVDLVSEWVIIFIIIIIIFIIIIIIIINLLLLLLLLS